METKAVVEVAPAEVLGAEAEVPYELRRGRHHWNPGNTSIQSTKKCVCDAHMSMSPIFLFPFLHILLVFLLILANTMLDNS